MTDEERRTALGLYKAPFKFDGISYVWDASGEMVLDHKTPQKDGDHGPILRVRGWGRICYMRDPEALHDAVGKLVAEALTDLWRKALP